MKTNHYILISLIVGVLVLASCGKDNAQAKQQQKQDTNKDAQAEAYKNYDPKQLMPMKQGKKWV